MGFIAEVVSDLIRSEDWGLSQKVNGRIRSVLLAIALLAAGAFLAGALAESHEETCASDEVVISAVSLPPMVPMTATNRNGVCNVVRTSTTTANPSN